jgi:FKBP-type peptidyl-prolyl cis-trans isomerase
MTDASVTDWDAHSINILKIKGLMKERDQARTDGEFASADKLRDRLMQEFDVVIIDQNNGPSGWRFKNGATKKLRRSNESLNETPQGESMQMKNKRKIEEVEDTSSKKGSKITSDTSSKKMGKSSDSNGAPSSSSAGTTAASSERARLAAALDKVIGEGAGSTPTAKTVQGVLIEDLSVGRGKQCKSGDRISVQYSGKLQRNGKVFDASRKPFVFRLGRSEVIRGWDIGCADMREGGKRRLTIPPEKAYGKSGSPPVIPPNATLVFDVTLLQVM